MSRWTRGAMVAAGALLLTCVLAPGQAPQPAAGDVLKVVPAGCMGFVVVSNVKDVTGKIDGFIRQISPSPEQALLPGSVLDMLKGQLEVGEGFNADGGLAAVMLDPQQYGLDLVGLIAGTGKPEKGLTPPLVVIVKGKDAAKIFPSWGEPAKEGEVLKFARPGAPVYAAQAGDFMLFGPNLKAVQAVAASKKSILEQLPASEKAFVTRNDLAVWVDLKMLAPTLDALLAKLQKEAEETKQVGRGIGPDQMVKAAFGNAAANWRELVKQLGALSMGARVDKAGLILECQCGFLPDSLMGKSLAANKPTAAPLLNRLPAMPYVLALGAAGKIKGDKEQREKEIDLAFSMEPYKSLSPEIKAKLREVMLGMNEQIKGMQLYLGGVTGGTGQVALACVVDCESAEKAKDLLASAVGIAADVIKTSKDENIQKFAVKYLKGVEAVGDKKADAISIDHPDIAGMSEGDRNKLKAVLGEDKVRVLVGQIDDKTLALTVGGGTGFLAEAMKVAQAGAGGLEKDAGIAKAIAVLPKEKVMVGVLNVSNIVTVIKNVSAALGEKAPPIEMAATTPLAFSASTEGANMNVTAYLPSDAIRETIKAVMGFIAGAMWGGAMAPGAAP